MGRHAGSAITEGTLNTIVGYGAGDNWDTESNNTAIGRLALSGGVAGGEYNVSVGNNTLDALTSADYNTAIGYNAGTGEVMHNAAIPGYISLADLKTEVAASADFAAFKARIAAL